ncbi:hypothetical protein SH139x_000770 [Planctomycetaceae bacterium SH139]
MTKVAIAEDIAERIRGSEGPIELIEAEIERARNRASKDGKRLSWAQVAAKLRDGVTE